MENKLANLHEDLIWEILLRLPVKSLVRFKCVSKSWLSLISDVNFTKLHYDLTPSSQTPQLVLSVSIVGSSKAQIQYLDPEGSLELVHSVNLVSPFQSPLEADYYVNILNVCRGFILLGHGPKPPKEWESPENLLVWNPSTGIHKRVSYSEIGSTLRCLLGYSICGTYRFEYDAITDDYFVVIAWIHRYFSYVVRLELFSMRTNSWRQCDVSFSCSRWHHYQHDFEYFNGALHWLDIESVKAVIAFDLTERNYSKIPLPNDGFDNNCKLMLKVIGGCLCLLCFGRQRSISTPVFAELWMMKEYKVWTKCNYVPQHLIIPLTPLPCFYFNPIYFTKAGQILGHSNLGLTKFNDKGGLLHHRKMSVKCDIYTESLLSLPTDSGQP